jgi:predicted aconitase
MRLSDEERAMLAGELGAVRRWGISHQIAVGEFFDAADFVPVSQAHIMADTESLGEAGVRFLEGLAAAPEAERRVRVPAITDPRGIDFAIYRRLGQTPEMAALEARAIEALRAFGVLMTDTCINYQTIMAPVRGEHMAYGDTGVVIYSNSVLGARSNFEGGPSALAAGLTGRTPRYGYHLDSCRRATKRFRLTTAPRDLSEWGVLGGIVGEACGSYWEVPVIEGIETVPGSDALKHFGTALASFGSVALFHMPGITAEESVFAGSAPPAITIPRDGIEDFLARYAAPEAKLDVVVFGAPQLSLFEIEAVARALDG